ncbi:Os11g0549683 [Oryza sativa Japonica Group]|uniref:Os11g0549683 protein n=1 Tax=Oryza sativa subsp. japonica TaxID=39947 RepID=A0A0P0Y354_ORYSJ|nr:Os11g0549683 [Oryza sativa Japonica Group]
MISIVAIFVGKAFVVANDKLLVIGGQQGDFMAIPGSPIFKCVRSEVVYSNVYMLDDGMRWKELPPMPKPDSHIEFALVVAQMAPRGAEP